MQYISIAIAVYGQLAISFYNYTYLILSNFQSSLRCTLQIESHMINGVFIAHAIIKSNHLHEGHYIMQ